MTKLDNAFLRASRNRDSQLASKVADFCRSAGWTYQDCVDRLAKVTGMSPRDAENDWEELMQEAECL